MSIVADEYERMEHGINALLKKEEYAPAEKAPVPCKHISDGFVYDDTPIFITLQCVKCSIQYDVLKSTGEIMG